MDILSLLYLKKLINVSALCLNQIDLKRCPQLFDEFKLSCLFVCLYETVLDFNLLKFNFITISTAKQLKALLV